MNTVFCSYSCTACGSHFTSLGAFDAHHSGDHATGRYCADPDEVPALRVASSMRA
jgi:hypothetical protein